MPPDTRPTRRLGAGQHLHQRGIPRPGADDELAHAAGKALFNDGTSGLPSGHGGSLEVKSRKRKPVFRCFGVSVFRCFGVSVFRCFGVSVFRCFGVSVFRCRDDESCLRRERRSLDGLEGRQADENAKEPSERP
jgi:hypothetical protein